jgi:hypothetical protein
MELEIGSNLVGLTTLAMISEELVEGLERFPMDMRLNNLVEITIIPIIL